MKNTELNLLQKNKIYHQKRRKFRKTGITNGLSDFFTMNTTNNNSSDIYKQHNQIQDPHKNNTHKRNLYIRNE